MTIQTLLTIGFFLCSLFCNGQKPNLYDKHIQDSLCTYGKKYNEPDRKEINFPAKKVSDDIKISALHKALPDSFNNEENNNWWYYQYYLGDSKLSDYDPQADSVYILPKEKQFYILRDTYFFDINGDGLLDFIHYPKYYKALAHDMENYEIFIQQKNGYKMLRFAGYIIDIDFNKDGTLNKMTTFFPECCDNNQCKFFHYTLDKKTSDLMLANTETLLVCQLIKRQK